MFDVLDLERLLRPLASMASPTRRSFLVPVDLAHAEAAKRSVEFVLNQLALTDKDSVCLLNVIASTTTQMPPSFGIGSDMLLLDTERDEKLIKADVERAEAFMIPFSARLAPADVKTAVVALATDATSVGFAILAHAAKIEASAIVIEKSGKSRLKEAFLGSTVELLVHRSPVPVIVLPHGDKA